MLYRYSILAVLTAVTGLAQAQTTSGGSNGGYTNYALKVTGDSNSTLYETSSTDTNPTAPLSGPPDVYLNASVNVGEIDIGVKNLSAKISLDATVLNLLQFNAGVDVSIDSVDLVIQNVTAKVLLEARLGNLVAMVTDVLESVDLNPVIATLGQTVSDVGSTVGGALGDVGSDVGGALGGLTKRDTIQGVLYSINDYAGDAHTNRVLLQDGSVVDQFLDNDGRVRSTAAVGDYTTLFTATGEAFDDEGESDGIVNKEYKYSPYVGLDIWALVSVNAQGQVVASRVLSELSAGGTSSISN